MLMEFKISENSRLCDLSLEQFRRKFGNILVCAIKRAGQVIIPDGDDILLKGDKIYVTGDRIEMILFHNFVKNKVIKNMMIIGAGRITYYLLNLLRNTKIKLKVIEITEKRSQYFSQEFPEIPIVLGDGTAKNILVEEGVENYDAVATLTGVDEENIISSMFLDTLGIEKNITKVNRTSLLEIIDTDDFSSIITPKSIAVDSMMHFIRGRVNAQESSTLDAVHHIANGKIETLQFEIREKNKIAGKQLADVQLKKGVLVAAIIRKGKPLFPTGQDTYEVGDKIVVVTLLTNIADIYDLLK